MISFIGKYTLIISIAILLSGCGESAPSILTTDETAEAGKIIESANQDLKKIKVLYHDNEGKRHELQSAVEASNVEEVKRISNEVVKLINEGTNYGNEAINKIRDARKMNINKDYNEYLGLKEESLMKQLEAFNSYHTAARILRDNYDPKDAKAHAKVKSEFDSLIDKYRELMEKARNNSIEANDLYKETLIKEQG
ncbi:MAG: hypothetical protein KF685_00430 [Acidobacteria bacterium]|nr:hypothetical protein [Acidobacteriota bacterium]